MMAGASTSTLSLTVRVTRRLGEAVGIDSFELAAEDGALLPPFTAGAHIDVLAPAGDGGIVRQYSLCNAPWERERYLIGVLDDPASRGGSRALHAGLAEGDTVRISAPRNHFELVPAARTLLFAGGIGVTPLLSMAAQLHAEGADFVLHYCARSRDRAAFLDLIAASGFARHVKLHVDDGEVAQRLDLQRVLSEPDPDTRVYVCGPGGFIDWVKSTATAKGWPAAQVRVEHFGAVALPPALAGEFDVRIASSGKLIRVAAHQSVTQALAGHGIEIPVSCMEGVCGTCITRVLEGALDHRDCYFSEEEKARNDQFMPCCSRSLGGTLVLDL